MSIPRDSLAEIVDYHMNEAREFAALGAIRFHAGNMIEAEASAAVAQAHAAAAQAVIVRNQAWLRGEL